MPSIKAYIDDFNLVLVSIPRNFFGGESFGFYILDEEDKLITCEVRDRRDFEQRVVYTLSVGTTLEVGKRYYLREFHGQYVPLIYRFITHKQKFNDLFTYYKEDLGSFYHKEYTDFALWSPTANSVILKLYLEHSECYEMKREDKGVYRIRINKDLEDVKYTYLVERNGEVVETIDPYGLSSDANGRHSAVIDTTKITSICDNAKLPPFDNVCDAIIYECNVRDISSIKTSGIKNASKYVGAYEKNTKYRDYPTGMDHITSLGITHIQLQPVLDYATVDEIYPKTNYNWGYDSAQFIALEGSYSLNPKDPYSRMIEFKKLVKEYHDAGIRVNLDVVYNHMYDSSNNPLENMVPYYYFRYGEWDLLSNGSYCGNDIESRQPMVKHLFIVALKTLLNLYNVDGYRFDLMGILDVDTMNIIDKELRKLKSNIMIYGEGWDLPTALGPEEKARIFNQYQMDNIAHFNDTFRDELRGVDGGYLSSNKGYLTGDLSKAFSACSVLSANTLSDPYYLRFDSPAKSINALETHDNLTCWDKMHNCCYGESNALRMQRQKMMIAFTLFAQGIPFIHAGMEFCATKNNIKDSYNAGDDVNGMHFERIEKYEDVLNYTKKCIAFRKEHPSLRLRTKKLIEERVRFEIKDEGILFYETRDENEILKIMVNPSLEHHQYEFNDEWEVVFDSTGHSLQGYYTVIQLPLCSIVILKKKAVYL